MSELIIKDGKPVVSKYSKNANTLFSFLWGKCVLNESDNAFDFSISSKEISDGTGIELDFRLLDGLVNTLVKTRVKVQNSDKSGLFFLRSCEYKDEIVKFSLDPVFFHKVNWALAKDKLLSSHKDNKQSVCALMNGLVGKNGASVVVDYSDTANILFSFLFKEFVLNDSGAVLDLSFSSAEISNKTGIPASSLKTLAFELLNTSVKFRDRDGISVSFVYFLHGFSCQDENACFSLNPSFFDNINIEFFKNSVSRGN